MATVNLSVNVGENKTITFHSGGTYNPEDIVFDVSANGSGYKPIQTAVSSPTASSTTSTTFIDTISQNANGVITATKKTLPTASSTVAGITKVGATGGAAAYSHNHTTSIATSTDTNQITLAFGTKYSISAGGTSYVFTMPANPNTNTTYSFATGDANGQIKVTPSGGSAQNVSVKGLGSAAYTESSAYATSGHTHTLSVETSNDASQITLTHNTKFKISAGGSSYVFTTPSLPFASNTVTGITKLGAAGGAATYDHTHGNVSSAGAVSTNTAIQSGDRLLITDASDSDKIKGTSITFGTSTSTYLRNDGTWGTPSGGSGGGSTVSANNITLSTSAQTYITVNGTSKTIKLPDTSPWQVDVPLATPMFDGNEKGSVIPIAKVTNPVEVLGDVKPYYEVSPVLMFPISIEDDKESYALPVYMDAEGHLFILLNKFFAEFLRNNMNYSTSSEY